MLCFLSETESRVRWICRCSLLQVPAWCVGRIAEEDHGRFMSFVGGRTERARECGQKADRGRTNGTMANRSRLSHTRFEQTHVLCSFSMDVFLVLSHRREFA